MSSLLHQTAEHGKAHTSVLGVEEMVGRGDKARLMTLTLSHVDTGRRLDFAYTLGKETRFGWCDPQTGSHERCPGVVVSAKGVATLCSCTHHNWETHDREDLIEKVVAHDDRRRCRNCGDVPGPKEMGPGHRPRCADHAACAKRFKARVRTEPKFARATEYRRGEQGTHERPAKPARARNEGQCANPACSLDAYSQGLCANCYSFAKRHGGAMRAKGKGISA